MRGESDNILSESKLENYIDEIKIKGFHVVIIELSIATLIFNYLIVIYAIEEDNNPEILK